MPGKDKVLSADQTSKMLTALMVSTYSFRFSAFRGPKLPLTHCPGEPFSSWGKRWSAGGCVGNCVLPPQAPLLMPETVMVLCISQGSGWDGAGRAPGSSGDQGTARKVEMQPGRTPLSPPIPRGRKVAKGVCKYETATVCVYLYNHGVNSVYSHE